jgi:hypothetical protein
LGLAEHLREEFGWNVQPARRLRREYEIAAARAALGEEAFGMAWNEGHAMTLREHGSLSRSG